MVFFDHVLCVATPLSVYQFRMETEKVKNAPADDEGREGGGVLLYPLIFSFF